MDGTLLSSVNAAERIWTQWATSHGLDVEAFLPTIHGVRAIETVRRQALAGVDPEAEADKITLAEIADVDGITPIGGVIEFLACLPGNRWAIVTSAPRKLALCRLEAAGVSASAILISADDVVQGKPDPEGYRLAAHRLGFAVEDCLVFEDAPAGIEAAERAGASVLVIRETHAHPLDTAHVATDDYRGLGVRVDTRGLSLISTGNLQKNE
jgi:sugar-phosphatase